MKYLLLLTLLVPPASALTELSASEGEPLAFPDAATNGTVTAGSVVVTDEGMVIATDLSASLYDFYGYVRPRYIRVYDGATGESAYVIDTIGEGDNRWEPFATDGGYRNYYFATNGKVFCVNGLNGDIYWEADVGGTLLEPPHLSGGYVYAVSGHYLIGLGAANGNELWRTWYRYRLDTPTAVVSNIVRVGATDKIEKPKLKPYTKRRDAVFNGVTGELIAGEYYQKNETEKAAIFEHFYSDRTLYVDKTDPSINFITDLRSRYVYDYDGVVYIESADDEVAAYGRASGEKLWSVEGFSIEDSSSDAIVLKDASAESGMYRCISAAGEDLWGEEVEDLIALDIDARFALTSGDSVVRRLRRGDEPGWTAPYQVYDYFGKDGDSIYVNDGRELIALEIETGDMEWSLKLNTRANYVAIIGGRPVIFNAFYIYALDPDFGDELWRVKNDRSFATKKSDSPYVYAAKGAILFVMHSNDVITSIDVTTGNVLWHRRYDFRTDLVKRTHCSDGLLTLEGNDGFYYVINMEGGAPVCKYRCEMMGDVWPERQPAGFIVGVDPYAIWYGFELP